MACIGRRVSVFTCVLLLFCVVLLVSFPAMSFAGAKVTETVLFSLDVQDEPLGSVCEKITQVTGYRIEIDAKWKDIPVNASVKGVSLQEGLMRILSKYNTLISVDDAAKKCEVMIFGRPGSIQDIPPIPKGNVLAAKDRVSSPNDEIIPPGEGNRRGFTVKQIEDIMARGAAGGGDDAEVAPPGGGKGLTKRDIEAMMKLQPSPEQKVVPPGFSGKRGLTVREIEAMMLDERKGDGQELPLLPPQTEDKKEGGNMKGRI